MNDLPFILLANSNKAPYLHDKSLTNNKYWAL